MVMVSFGKKAIWIVLVFIICLPFAANSSCLYNFSSNAPTIGHEERMHSVLRLGKQPGNQFLGTAFVFDAERGLLFTAYHVLKNNHVLEADNELRENVALEGYSSGLNDGVPLSLKLIDTFIAYGYDVAVLKIEDVAAISPPPAALDLSFWVPSLGSQLNAIGYSGTDGHLRPHPQELSRIIRKDDSLPFLGGQDKALHDMYESVERLAPGYSGGPLLDPLARAIAIINAIHHGAINSAYFVPLRVLPFPLMKSFFSTIDDYPNVQIMAEALNSELEERRFADKIQALGSRLTNVHLAYLAMVILQYPELSDRQASLIRCPLMKVLRDRDLDSISEALEEFARPVPLVIAVGSF